VTNTIEPHGRQRDARIRRYGDWVLYCIVGFFLAMIVVRAATSGWVAGGDFAVIRMRTLDVGTGSTPLVGVYSRFEWNHPGPALFYAYAPLLRVVGGASFGLLLGATIVNGLSIGAALWLARRASSLACGVVALVLAVAIFAFGAAEIMNPWNPFIGILPHFCCVNCRMALLVC